jgi:hypothetical protein
MSVSVGKRSVQNPKFLPQLKIESYAIKCDCVLVCMLVRRKSHIDINVLIQNCYLKSGFLLVEFQSTRFFRDKLSADQNRYGRNSANESFWPVGNVEAEV